MLSECFLKISKLLPIEFSISWLSKRQAALPAVPERLKERALFSLRSGEVLKMFVFLCWGGIFCLGFSVSF